MPHNQDQQPHPDDHLHSQSLTVRKAALHEFIDSQTEDEVTAFEELLAALYAIFNDDQAALHQAPATPPGPPPAE